MSGRPDKMNLAAMISAAGTHIAGWRHPLAEPSGSRDAKHAMAVAQAAEAAKIDLIFLADNVGFPTEDLEIHRRSSIHTKLEPLTLLSAISTCTSQIGLVATASTSYNEPYHIARKFASLDHISEGRAGWNVVTSAMEAEALNFGFAKHFEHADRYATAHEFIEVVRGLWDSWEDDAFLMDQESGIYFDPEKLHVLNHAGERFTVRGPLSLPRSPQGHPVIFQAGSSDVGMALAAKTADCVFTNQPSIERARGFYQTLKALAVEEGRNPDQLRIMPGLAVVTGPTRAAAQQKFDDLQALIHPEIGLHMLGRALDVDLTGVAVDGPLPEIPETNSSKSAQQNLIEMARRDNLTVEQLYRRYAASRGNWIMIGTPDEVADQMAEAFLTRAVDGFAIAPTHLPEGHIAFFDQVVPALQARGVFRTEYEGHSLRDRLGLDRPAHPAA